MKPRPIRMKSTSQRNSSLSNWRHCTFPHSAQCSTSSPRNMPIAWMSSFSSRCRSRVRWIHCAGVPGHKKSELRAHQMARICGVPASLRKKIRAELSSNVSSRPAESSSNGSCWVSLAQKMRKFRDAGDFSLRDGDSLDSFHVRWIRCRRPVSLRLCLRLHFCRCLRAVSTCSRADGRVSRPRLTSCFAIVSRTS